MLLDILSHIVDLILFIYLIDQVNKNKKLIIELSQLHQKLAALTEKLAKKNMKE